MQPITDITPDRQPRESAGSVQAYAQRLADELNALSTETTDSAAMLDPWWVSEATDGGGIGTGTWNILGHHCDDAARLSVRRQWNNPNRVTVSPELPNKTRDYRTGYRGAAADQAAVKPLTASITGEGSAAMLARRIAKGLPAYLELLGRAIEWQRTREANMRRRDAVAGRLTTLYGGRADGLDKPGRLTVTPGLGRVGGAYVQTIELEADGTVASGVTLRNVPTDLLGPLLALLGY